MDLLPGVHSRRDLVAAGYTDAELRHAVRSGAVELVRPGAYLAGPSPSRDEEKHALLVRATAERLAPGAVVSHISAAVLFGLPVWNVALSRVHATRDRGNGGRCRPRTHVHAASLDADELCVVDGIMVTSPARTVVDVARTTGFEQAVVVADAALRLGLVEAGGLAAALARGAGRRGTPAARRVVAFADGLSESPGESRSRVAIARAGLPVPVLQWEVRAADGLLIGRTDFAWPELRTVGEFDGRSKYQGRMLRPGETPAHAVLREKRREDEVRGEELGVVRWDWDDLAAFGRVAERLRRSFARTR